MDYKYGFVRLRKCLEQRAASDVLFDFYTLEDQFYKNEYDERILGNSENIRHERSRIIRSLNKLASDYCQMSFNDMCRRNTIPHESRVESHQDSGDSDLQPDTQLFDFAIITALQKEAKAIIRRLEKYNIKRFESEDIRTYHCGTIPISGTDKEYRIVSLLLPNMGEVPAATAVTDTIARWHPRFVLMVGIAGGIHQDDLDLGDVVVADQIIGYEYSKVTDEEIKPRDRVYPASAMLLDRVRNFWDESWKKLIGIARPKNAVRSESKLFIGPIASGNKVIASTEFRERLKKRWPKLMGLEMEGEGVFAATFDRPQIPPTLVIRGICDMADERKSDEWQEYAANAAAAFTINFLKSGPLESQT